MNNTGSGLGRLDGTKCEDLTVSEREGLKAAIDFVNIVREKKIPGLEDCYLMRTGAHVGAKKLENLLVAGRCGSATHLGHAAGKSMGNSTLRKPPFTLFVVLAVRLCYNMFI